MPQKIKVSDPKAVYSSNNPKKSRNKTLEELRYAALSKAPLTASAKEKRKAAYERSEALKVYVIVRSNGWCEGCRSEAPFQTKKGPFLECHHVHRLADGGPDHPQNVVALCPNCHRRAHYAKDSVEFNKELKAVAVTAEENAR